MHHFPRFVQIVLIVFFLAGCTVQPAPGVVEGFPTPTVSPNFFAHQLPETVPSTGPAAQADLGQAAAAQAATPAESTLELAYLPLYDDEVNRDWMIQRSSGSLVNSASQEEINEGSLSIAFTPKGEGSQLYLVVKESTSTNYLRDQVWGLSFWLNGGEYGINADEIAVTVLGSNSVPHWDSADISVKSPYDPVFSETRLYYLGVNSTIPAHTWVKVELWLDERIYDPAYHFVTGFYIKAAESLNHTIYLDDIELILLQDEPTLRPAAEVVTNAPFNPAELQPVWTVMVDAQRNAHPISPFIYGISVASEEVVQALRPGLNSWGGNPSTRYNWELGNAWNAGRDYFFKNGNYGITSGSASDMFIEEAMEAGAAVRLAVPVLGWVAKNDDMDTCSFPTADGECSDVPRVTCELPSRIADPNLANVPSDPESIRAWMEHIYETQGYEVRFVAMDNEPELWGYTHYDVHPDCPTYAEILEKYLDYATVVREVAPQAEITGPVTCCWYYYWNSAAGAMDKLANGNKPFLPWFLENVRKHDLENETRTIDVLDIHYYQEGVYNQEIDEPTAALRLRSTRSLWDPSYIDESWINEPVMLIPRMKEMIAEYYPGLKLGISEWNWGGDQHMNGALAIADVLGIFGREDLYLASYWTHPPLDSPGFFAFKMFTNYDDRGSRFGNISVWASSTDDTILSSFAALDSKTGQLHVLLINKQPDQNMTVQINLSNFRPSGQARVYQYSQADLTAILPGSMEIAGSLFDLTVPAYSITLLVLEPASIQNTR